LSLPLTFVIARSLHIEWSSFKSSTWVGSRLDWKYQTRVNVADRGKQFSLILGLITAVMSFIIQAPFVNLKNVVTDDGSE